MTTDFKVAVLFARADSVYKTLPGCDVYDRERDARTFKHDLPVIAHPPCRLFSRLRRFSTAPSSERQLAFFAIDAVRRCGGVLEHPAHSTLFTDGYLPLPGRRDSHGFTLQVSQFWWGHKAEKKTWLYVCGLSPDELPPVPVKSGEPSHVVATTQRSRCRPGEPGYKPELSKADRERTPENFANWLIHLVDLIKGRS